MWLLCFAEFLRPNSMASWCWQERVKENPKAEAIVNQRPQLCPSGRWRCALQPRLFRSSVPGKEIQSTNIWSPMGGVKEGVCQLVGLTLRQSPLRHWLKPDQNILQYKFSFQVGSNLLSELKPLQAPVVAKASFGNFSPTAGSSSFPPLWRFGTPRCELSLASLNTPPPHTYQSPPNLWALPPQFAGPGTDSITVGTQLTAGGQGHAVNLRDWSNRDPQRPTSPMAEMDPWCPPSVLCKNQYTKIKNLQYTICKIKELKIT